MMRQLLIITLVAVFGTALPAWSVDKAYFLVARQVNSMQLPDGKTVPVWGYADCGAGFAGCDSAQVTVPGPQLVAAPGDDLVINLRNDLPVPVSFVVPGQKLTVSTGQTVSTAANDVNGQPFSKARALSLRNEVLPGATTGAAPFRFAVLASGAYRYESSTHPSLQVPMGLYGSLVVGGGSADYETTIVLGEIDRRLNIAVAAAVANPPQGSTATNEFARFSSQAFRDAENPVDTQKYFYSPAYYLMSVRPWSAGSAAATSSETAGVLAVYPNLADIKAPNTVLYGKTNRQHIINSGSRVVALSLLGTRLNVSAEDGRPIGYRTSGGFQPQPKAVTTLTIAPGKTFTTDMVSLDPAAKGYHAFFDRRLGLGDADGFPGRMLTFVSSWDPAVENCTPANRGDVNNDGVVNVVDVFMVLRYIALNGNYVLPSQANALVSQNVDPVSGLACVQLAGPQSGPTLADALLILQKSVGMSPF